MYINRLRALPQGPASRQRLRVTRPDASRLGGEDFPSRWRPASERDEVSKAASGARGITPKGFPDEDDDGAGSVSRVRHDIARWIRTSLVLSANTPLYIALTDRTRHCARVVRLCVRATTSKAVPLLRSDLLCGDTSVRARCG